MTYVGPLYIFSHHDKYLYILATINGEVIEQLFHVSRLKKGFFVFCFFCAYPTNRKGFLKVPNGKTVTNISDYKLSFAEAKTNTNLTQRVTQTVPENVENDRNDTKVKSVFQHLSISNTDKCRKIKLIQCGI